MEPNLLKINVPDGVEVRGELYDTLDPAWLTQDVLSVIMPGEVIVDVGWYPEHDPEGKFWIRVFHKTWENQLWGSPFYTRHPKVVQALVQVIAHMDPQQLRSFLQDPLLKAAGIELDDG